MVQLLRDIGEVLKLYPGKQGILLLDCAPSHLPKEVMQAAKRQKVQLVYIPAQCTDVLQPLDICAFAGFKAFLRARHEGTVMLPLKLVPCRNRARFGGAGTCSLAEWPQDAASFFGAV